MRILWISLVFAIPIIWIFHWSINTVVHNVQNTVVRLVTAVHWALLSMLAAVFAIQVVPLSDARAIAVYVIGSLGVLLAAFGTHLHLKLLGWLDRWPRGTGLFVAYIWVLPGIWTVAMQRNLFNVDHFVRRGFWVTPIYNSAFHLAMWIASVLVAGFVAGLWTVTRRRSRTDPSWRTLRGLLLAAAGLGLALVAFGALLPNQAPAWMPPYPYLVGMLWWVVVLRVVIVRYELLPSHLKRYQALFTLSPVPIVIVDRLGTIVDRNPAAVTLLGGGYRSWAEICAGSDSDSWSRFRAAWARLSPIEGFKMAWWDTQSKGRSLVVDGQYVSIGDRTYSILSIHDETHHTEEHQKLSRLVDQDPLTGVLNRRAFERHLEAAIEDEGPEWKKFGVFFVDCDGFKTINDENGHLIGDIVLLELARRLQTGLRPVDQVGRFGGDEFTVLVSGIGNLEEGFLVQERILERCRAPISVGNTKEVSVSISVGWSRFPDDGRDGASLLRIADWAMYQMKRQRQQARRDEGFDSSTEKVGLLREEGGIEG